MSWQNANRIGIAALGVSAFVFVAFFPFLEWWEERLKAIAAAASVGVMGWLRFGRRDDEVAPPSSPPCPQAGPLDRGAGQRQPRRLPGDVMRRTDSILVPSLPWQEKSEAEAQQESIDEWEGKPIVVKVTEIKGAKHKVLPDLAPR
jgi:hypothetical protein